MDSKQKKQAIELLMKKNVVSVGTGSKKVDGKDTAEPSLVIGVSKKEPIESLSAQDMVPKKVNGMPTDVVEVGEIHLFENVTRQRPALPGCSIGHKDITAGTLGAIVKEGNISLILSNNHVLANVNKGKIGDAILQPGAYDKGQNPADAIASLYRFIEIETISTSSCPFWSSIVSFFNWLAGMFNRHTRLTTVRAVTNKVDCALAKPTNQDDVNPYITGIGAVTGVGGPVVGLEVMKSGRTTDITEGKITSIDTMCNVNMGDGGYAIFEDQMIIEGVNGKPFSAGGDSGSLIVDKSHKAIGLLFAGSDKITIGNEIQNVLDALGVKF